MTKAEYSCAHSSQLSCLLSPGEVVLEQAIVKRMPFLFLVTRQFSFWAGPSKWSEWDFRGHGAPELNLLPPAATGKHRHYIYILNPHNNPCFKGVES